MAMSKEEIIINKHIDELRERMRILQNDRKTNIEMWEETKKRNVEEMKRLKEENRDFRQKVATLQRMQIEATDEDEQRHLEGEVDNLRRTYDQLRIQTERLKKRMQEIYDGMRAAEIESEKPQLSDNEYTRKIRSLENNLDTSMIKFNEAQGIKKTYEQIVYRLRDEKFGYDHQLALTERQLNAKQRDYDELQLLSNDAYHAKEVAFQELESHRRSYEDNQKSRERELREKHQLVQLRKQMVERNKERELLRLKLLENENKEKSLQLYNSIRDKNALQTEKLQIRNKIDIFEEAFRKIKEATGVSNVNEVIEKIITQSTSTESLINLSRENQIKIESLHQQYRKLKIYVEDLKYTQSTSGQYRKLLDSEEENLQYSKEKLSKTQGEFERLSKLLIVLKSGVGHLQDILEPLMLDMSADPQEPEASMVFNTLISTEYDNNDERKKKAKSEADLITDANVTYKLQDYQRLIAHLLIALNHPNTIPPIYVALDSSTQQGAAGNKFSGALASDDNDNASPSAAKSGLTIHHQHHAAAASDVKDQLPLSTASTGQTPTMLAIEENIQEYMTKSNYGSSSAVCRQSSDLDDVATSYDNKLATKTAYLTLTSGADVGNENGGSHKSLILGVAGDNTNLTTAAAIGQVGKGIEFNPSKLRQPVILDDDEEDEETNRHKRVDVKRASAEILRKMEMKQKQLKNDELKKSQVHKK